MNTNRPEDKEAAEAVRRSYLLIADDAVTLQKRNIRFLGRRKREHFLLRAVGEQPAMSDSSRNANRAARGKAESVRESYLALAERATALQKHNAHFSGWE